MVKKFEIIAETIEFLNSKELEEIMFVALSHNYDDVTNIYHLNPKYNIHLDMILIEFELISFESSNGLISLDEPVISIERHDVKLYI